MSLDHLMKIIDADDKRKALNQETNTPEPTKDVKESSNENVSNESEDLGSESVKDETTSNENETDVKEPSETSKDEKKPETVKKQELTEKQKQEYAFRKEWGKQEKKHSAEMNAIKLELENLKKSLAKPEVKVTQDNFDTVEEFKEWEDQQRIDKIKNELRKEQLETLESQKIVESKRTAIVEKVETLFEGPEDKKLYNDMVSQAIDMGLDGFLKNENKEQTIRTFIDDSNIGPLVLQYLIGYPEKLKEIYDMRDVLDKKVELKLLEREIKSNLSKKKVEPVINSLDKKVSAPILGKLGSLGSNNTSSKLSKAEEDAEVLRYIRGR